jgi:hypothetical protein
MRALKDQLVKPTTPAAPAASAVEAGPPAKPKQAPKLADAATLADIREAEKLLEDLRTQALLLPEEHRGQMWLGGWELIYEFLAGKPKVAARFLVEQVKYLLDRAANRERAGIVVPFQLAEHLRKLEEMTDIVRIVDEAEAAALREESPKWKPIRTRHRAHSAKGEREDDCPICGGDFGPAQVWTFKFAAGSNTLGAVNFVLNFARGEHVSQAYELRNSLQVYWGEVNERRDAANDWGLRHGFLRKEEFEDGSGKKRTRVVTVQGLPTVADLQAGRVEADQRIRIHIPKNQALQSPGTEGRTFWNWGEAVALVNETGKTVKFCLFLPEGEEAELLGNLHKALGRQSGELFEFVPDVESSKKPFYGLQSKDRRPNDRLQRVLTHALRLEEDRASQQPTSTAAPAPKTGEVEARVGAAMVSAVALVDPEPTRKQVAQGKAQ